MTELDERMAWIKNTLASVPEGAALLKLAEDSGTRIIFDDTLPRADSGQLTRGRFTCGGNKTPVIRINPLVKNKMLVQTLAHELRHLWQHSRLGFQNKKKLKPLDRLIFMRLIEGDANAFAALVAAKIRKKLKQKITCELHGVIAEADRYRIRDPEFIMPAVFENYQAALNKNGISHYETATLNVVRAAYENKTPGTLDKTLTETFSGISAVLSMHGTSGKRNYLDAVDANDFCAKMTALMLDDVKKQAAAYTPAARQKQGRRP